MKIKKYLIIAIILITLPVMGFILAEVLSNSPYTVVGTGVNVCYNNTGIISCPTSPSAPFYGQNPGITPSYQDNGNGTITDLRTDLMWIAERGNKMSWDSTFLMASQCNTGGYSDWRVPTIKELYSLINFNGKSGLNMTTCIPYIDTTYFGWKTGDTTLGERVIDGQDWSATKYKALTMVADSTIFGVNFVDGRIKGYPQYKIGGVKNRLFVRFVRGNTNYGINNYVDNGDSTITDNSTGLIWAKNDSRYGMNWQNALSYAQTKNSQNYLGFNDWRLPTAKELQSIVDYTRCKDFTNSAAIDPIFNISTITDEGGSTNWPFFWSNTTLLEGMISGSWGVYVTFGEALGWMKIPPTSSYYTLFDVHGAGTQRSDPKSGSYTSYFLGYDINNNPAYGLGPQGDVIRINNYVRLVRGSSTVGINNQEYVTPDDYKLHQNYPNPFNPSTVIRYEIPKNSFVKVAVYDALGRELEILVNQNLNTGKYEVTFNSSQYSSGIYFYRLTANDFSETKKMLLLK